MKEEDFDSIGFWVWDCPYVWWEGPAPEDCFRFYIVAADTGAVFTERNEITTIQAATNSTNFFSLLPLSKCAPHKKEWLRNYFLVYSYGVVDTFTSPDPVNPRILFDHVKAHLRENDLEYSYPIDLRVNGHSIRHKSIVPTPLKFMVDLFDPATKLFHLKYLIPWEFGDEFAPPIEIPLLWRRPFDKDVYFPNLIAAVSALNIQDQKVITYIHTSALKFSLEEEWSYVGEGFSIGAADSVYHLLISGERFTFWHPEKIPIFLSENNPTFEGEVDIHFLPE